MRDMDEALRMIARRRANRVLLFSLVLAVTAGAAHAHHILGIPHYKYDENYPQIPYLEVVAQVGEYDLDFTYYPGLPEPGERIRLKLYVRNRKSGEVFREPLRVEVVRKRFLRAPEPASAPMTIRTGTGPESNDYKFFLTFPAAEAYELRVAFPSGEGIETIPFPVVIGRTSERPLILGAFLILVSAVCSVAWIKRRRKARLRRQRRAA